MVALKILQARDWDHRDQEGGFGAVGASCPIILPK
jgi:hypothetical protein